MRFRSTIGLLLLLGLLLGGYFGMMHREERSRRRTHDAQRAFHYAPEDLVRISIQQEDRRPTVGVRVEDMRWTIVEPYPLDAYNVLWNRVARHLSELTNQRIVEETISDPAAYEFHDPRLLVQAETVDGEVLEVAVGKAGPTQTNRYALINQGLVSLINEEAYFELNRSLDLLRRHHLFTFDPEEGIHRVEFAWIWTDDGAPDDGDGPRPGDESIPISVEYVDDSWQMVEPEPGPVHHETVMEFVNALLSGTCSNFVDEPEALSDYGLDPPQARATVYTTPESAPQTVYFGTSVHRDGESYMYAKWAEHPSVFTVRQAMEARFPRSPSAFLERRLLTTEAKTLRVIDIETEETHIRIERDVAGGWVIAEPPGYETDQRAVSNFIGVLTHLEGREHVSVSPAEAGLDAPRAIIRLEAEGDETPRAIRIGDPTSDGETCYVTQDTGALLTMAAAIGDNIAAMELFRFRSKDLVTFSVDRAESIELTLDGEDYRFAFTGRSWRVAHPEEHVWESQDDMMNLLEAINPVQAIALEAAEATEGLDFYGLDQPVMVLTVRLNDEAADAPPVLRVGSVTPDNSRHRFAMIDGISEVYRIRQAHIDDIRQAIQGVRPR